MTGVTPARGVGDVASVGSTWVRRNGLRWSDIEPTEMEGFSWDAPGVKALEQEMLNASKHNLKLILIVRGSPRWATEAATDCGPIRPDRYGRFASFMAAAVARYSAAPFNVRRWELGNEIDVDRDLVEPDNIYGCWGNPNDDYYGGRAYGDMLKVVYPAMKAANSTVQVLNGGLLLDSPYNAENGSGRPARFLEGVFAAGAGLFFDIVSYHSYFHYRGPGVDSPNGITTAGNTDGVDWKIRYLRDMMNRYNVPQKPLLNTETALLCRTTDVGACRQAQADAVGRMYARAAKEGVLGYLWYLYDSDSFFNTGLVEPRNVTERRPAYFAYKHAALTLGGATYLGTLSGQRDGVEGYRFRDGTATITIFWSNNAQTASIPVGSARVSCTNREGGAIGCTNNGGRVTLEANNSPTYVIEGR